MKFHRIYALALCTLLALPSIVLAQAAPVASKQIAPGESLNVLANLLEREVTSAADAMPAEKYNFAPAATSFAESGMENGKKVLKSSGPTDFKGVRDFGSQVKHLAESNYEFFEGWGVPDAVDPKTIEALKTKDEIMKALKDSYAYLHAALNSITVDNAFAALPGPENRKATRVSAAAFCMAHSMDHYGQLVEYLRMNSIIPPASRKSGM
jgi:hypothetical protein